MSFLNIIFDVFKLVLLFLYNVAIIFYLHSIWRVGKPFVKSLYKDLKYFRFEKRVDNIVHNKYDTWHNNVNWISFVNTMKLVFGFCFFAVLALFLICIMILGDYWLLTKGIPSLSFMEIF